MPDEVRAEIDARSAGYADPVGFYVDKIVEGVATLGAAFTPHPVIVRLSDFKSNEYANMVGGALFEPDEENPMIGFRGASRYLSSSFEECFALECRALKRVRDEMGLTNVELMVPFVRTLEEADQVIALNGRERLARGENGLRVVMMCEVPSNAILAEEFLERFDGFSIGSNDLTQLTLGLDRDSGARRPPLRRAGPRRDEAARPGHRRGPRRREVRRHLRTGGRPITPISPAG